MSRFRVCLCAVFGVAGCGLVSYDEIVVVEPDAAARPECLALAGDELVVRYSLDELDPGATGVLDSSSNGVSATCSAATCPSSVPGRFGTALFFERDVPTYLDVDASPRLEVREGYTISLWFNYSAITGTGLHSMFAKRAGTSEFNSWQLGLSVNSMSEPRVGLIGDNMNMRTEIRSDGLEIGPGRWFHLAATWGGPGGGLSLFVDGAPVAESAGAVDIEFDGGPTMIGSDPDPGPTDSYDGALDELRLYDRALDASEIATLIACGDSP